MFYFLCVQDVLRCDFINVRTVEVGDQKIANCNGIKSLVEYVSENEEYLSQDEANFDTEIESHKKSDDSQSIITSSDNNSFEDTENSANRACNSIRNISSVVDEHAKNNDQINVLPNGCFDAVVFSFLLEYIPTPSLRLKCCLKAYEVLKTGE